LTAEAVAVAADRAWSDPMTASMARFIVCRMQRAKQAQHVDGVRLVLRGGRTDGRIVSAFQDWRRAQGHGQSGRRFGGRRCECATDGRNRPVRAVGRTPNQDSAMDSETQVGSGRVKAPES
jgi:hypothetical protein